MYLSIWFSGYIISSLYVVSCWFKFHCGYLLMLCVEYFIYIVLVYLVEIGYLFMFGVNLWRIGVLVKGS